MTGHPPLTARLAREGDLGLIFGLRDEAERWLARRGIRQWTARWRESARRRLRGNVARREAWVFHSGGLLVATVTLSTRPDPDFWDPEADGPALYLSKLLVSREYGGAGIGADIVAWSVDRAARRGLPWVRLDVWRANHALQRYYRRLGFDHVRTVVVDGRESGACFQRAAAPTPVPAIVEL